MLMYPGTLQEVFFVAVLTQKLHNLVMFPAAFTRRTLLHRPSLASSDIQPAVSVSVYFCVTLQKLPGLTSGGQRWKGMT